MGDRFEATTRSMPWPEILFELALSETAIGLTPFTDFVRFSDYLV